MKPRAFMRHCWRCTHAHLIRNRRRYASASMIYMALVVFVADAGSALAHLPVVSSFLNQNHWTVPVAAFLGHSGFILERAGDGA